MSLVLCTREEESRSLVHGILMVTPDQAEEYLMHWRTRGSKNGIRRYQYEDGSLTPLGYIHYGVGQGNRKAKKAEKAKSKYQDAEIRKNKAQVKYDEAKLRNERKGDERSEQKLARASSELDKATFKADKLKLKSNKLTKESEKQEKKGQKQIEKDKAREEREAKRAQEATERAVDKFVEEWNKKYNKQENAEETNKGKELNKAKGEFDNLSSEDKKKTGDEILSYLDKTRKELIEKYRNKEVKNIENDNSYADYDDLGNWLINRVYDKSGSWNAGYFDPKSNAAKSYPEVEKAYKNVWKREEEIESKVGKYVAKGYDGGKGYDKWRKENFESDSAWKDLSKEVAKAEDKLCGSILEDIGFRDTPENRKVILDWAYLD